MIEIPFIYIFYSQKTVDKFPLQTYNMYVTNVTLIMPWKVSLPQSGEAPNPKAFLKRYI
jgi:hypothetical protein